MSDEADSDKTSRETYPDEAATTSEDGTLDQFLASLSKEDSDTNHLFDIHNGIDASTKELPAELDRRFDRALAQDHDIDDGVRPIWDGDQFVGGADREKAGAP